MIAVVIVKVVINVMRGVLNLPNLRKNIIPVSSSDFGDVERKVRVLNAIHKLKQTKIICVQYEGNPRVDQPFLNKAKAKLGVEIKQIGPRDLIEAYNVIDEVRAEKLAKEWIENAEKVVEPTKEDIVKAARLYFGIKRIMEKENASAIVINCWMCILENLLPAYPCLAFSQLNNEGLVGTCEGDLACTLTQLIVGYVGNKPGFVTDPSIDTATNAVTHYHCVAPTKMDGPDGEVEPYIIRNNAGTYASVSLQVKMKVGQKVTIAKFVPFEKLLISTGVITGNIDTERACRTHVATKVKDAKKMLENYSGGLHRVLFYGEWTEEVKDLGKLLGFEVVEEM